jgi:hypothetical protein
MSLFITTGFDDAFRASCRKTFVYTKKEGGRELKKKMNFFCKKSKSHHPSQQMKQWVVGWCF